MKQPHAPAGLLRLLLGAACVATPSADDSPPPKCGTWFRLPGAPEFATDLNGYELGDTCFWEGENHVFVIGDWGGVVKNPWSDDPTENQPMPADHRHGDFTESGRKYVFGVDDRAQQLVAAAMEARAARVKPEYVLNVGDNFYWGGVNAHCGAPIENHFSTGQWKRVYEQIYNGTAVKPLQWLGVLGNHDYGGWKFTAGWDQTIGHSWDEPTGRWVQPALYWKSKVWYTGFSVDYFFVDTNYFAADDSNICSKNHNGDDESCGHVGPNSVDDCQGWFKRLWEEQVHWMMDRMGKSTADWQIVVTHLPPTFGRDQWYYLSQRFGIDLIITGHIHLLEVHGPEAPDNFFQPTAWVISGGGGGITSQGVPSKDGQDDQYGFLDLTLTEPEITIEAVSHGGHVRSTTWVRKRMPDTVIPPGHDPWPFSFANPEDATTNLV